MAAQITRRFLRSISIETDLNDDNSLEGYICPQSSANVLRLMARHISETGQGAFTWTGPYGSGKSSLALALSSLLGSNDKLRERAAEIVGSDLATAIWSALPIESKGWRILPVVGRREPPVKVIGEAMQTTGMAQTPAASWTEISLGQAINNSASDSEHGGLIIFIDEMGKFLEASAQDGTDIYFFQRLAEAASRSNGRLVIVGILHQAFERYAHRLSHEARDEWAKIQGRFVDLPINATNEEQIYLISRALEGDPIPYATQISYTVAAAAYPGHPVNAQRLATLLDACQPLHPVVACLLGPMSRRRFGQNQRSIFAFLNSSEPHGFQDFLKQPNGLYGPDQLWDYLRANLEPTILASPDGHRWALASEALERCEAAGGDILHVRLLKTIAVIDLFKERSGIAPSLEVIYSCFTGISERELKRTLNQLEKWSLIIFKKFLAAYAIYAGSDFDIEGAVNSELATIESIDFGVLNSFAELQPILAKRHYHETGSMRWFNITLAPLHNVIDMAHRYRPEKGAAGQFIFAIPTDGENMQTAEQICTTAANLNEKIVVGISERSWSVVTSARELIALENVRNNRAELAGDAVARREVSERLGALQSYLDNELHQAIDGALWFHGQFPAQTYRRSELTILASVLADKWFDQSPKLHNELLNRQKPSSNAIAAQNVLLRTMVLNEGKPRLGISGYPAEGGLFDSLLEATGLYTQQQNGWQFMQPSAQDLVRLAPMWNAASEYVTANSDRIVAISEIYELWRAQPFGVKDGLLPVLAVAFILSSRRNLAIYREGMFRARFDDVDADYLAKDAKTIQVRWIGTSNANQSLISDLARVIQIYQNPKAPIGPEPIGVARALVAIFEQLPAWTKRTATLSPTTSKLRDLLKRAHDPNQLLFNDLPDFTGELSNSLAELTQAYSLMLGHLRELMLRELLISHEDPSALAQLRERAINIRQLASDYHLEAFIARLCQFDSTEAAFEGIASLAVNKPPRDWTDREVNNAAVNLAELAQSFLRLETFARVKGRPEKRQAIAVLVGANGQPTPFIAEFQVADTDHESINLLVDQISGALTGNEDKNIILAALAEITARYIGSKEKETV